ncbi:MAG: hypothetical protein KAY37_07360 [Phycisphaerae bacterium]|nr:hypothetical protein [Phycisphaerae bacterium]
MRPKWIRYKKWCVALSYGGITLGILQGLEMVRFADLLTGALTSFLSGWVLALLTLLFGGDPSAIV